MKKNKANAIVTVIGTDCVGIVAKVSAFLAERHINIEEINQTILSGNFVMIMSIDLSLCTKTLDALKKEIKELGESVNVSVSILNENVFTAMHRI